MKLFIETDYYKGAKILINILLGFFYLIVFVLPWSIGVLIILI